MFVQDVVAIDVVRQRERHALGHAAEHDRQARKAQRRIASDVFEKVLRALAKLNPELVHHLLALAPRQHEEGDDERDSKGNQPPSKSLVEVEAKNRRSSARRLPLTV